MAEHAPKFSFQPVENKKFFSIEGKDYEELLLKWSMKGRIKIQAFSFDQSFAPYQKDGFLLAFMQDPCVLSTLQVVSSSGLWVPVGIKAKSVSVEEVPCSVLSMEFFDRLKEHNIVRDNDRIQKCFDEPYEDFMVSDELRKMLLIEDSDNYDIYSEDERQQFLFRLFRHLCLGGQVCQYEDFVTPYLNLTKLMYKDLVSVVKDPETKELRIASWVYKITASDDNDRYYPSHRDHEQDFAYLIVDPLKRLVYVLYHKFGASDFS